MTYAASVLTGYLVTTALVALYAFGVLRRGRVLGRSLGIGRSDPDAGPPVDSAAESADR